jgi:Bifunctional DNA primase/polymerase, N-terminal/Primase C terminal 2 (PriCT-2)/Protein of unknown function (DUF3987)
MPDQSFMERFGPRLVANGYPILPIMPGTKKPGRFRSGTWSDYPDWTRHAERPTTEHELAAWQTWPEAGIGIVCGPVIGIDIDVADAELALELERLARARLGNTPALRIGRAPKRLLVYRAAEPFAGIRRAPIEVLGLGQQFVAHAVHPDTGRPYEWPEESLADIDVSDLPAVGEAAARAFLDDALALVPDHLRPARLAASRSSGTGPAHAQAGTTAAIREALAWIPNADLDYDSWIRIGLALKGALGDAGGDLFAAWSAQSGKDDAAFTAKTWSGLKAERIGAGTVYHLAMERGWRPDPALVLDGAAAADPVHPAAALLATLDAPPAPAEPVRAALELPPPPELDRLDGALSLLVRHILATAIRPQPWLAVGAALSALGTLMGRKVRTASNLRSNLYVLGLAESGGGKDHARKVIKEVLFQAGLADHLGGERIASGAGLITALTRQPASLFQIDEFGKFVANVADKRRAPKHLSEIWDLFTELATSAGTTFFGAEYADQRERPRQDIIEPCASIHGVSAPGPFWEALKSGSLQDGSLARFLVFRSEDDIPDRNRRPAPLADLPADLLEAVKAVAAVGADQPRGNLAGIGAPGVKPAPLTVQMDAEAAAIFDMLDDEMTRRQREAVGTDQSAALARVWENAAKVALIKAVSADPIAPTIRGEDAQWAREVVEHCVATLLIQAERHLANNETERCSKRIVELVRAAGHGGLRQRDLTRKLQFIEPKLRRELIADLVESEQLVAVSSGVSGRPATTYRIGSPA